jgi:hypothetical protein
MVAENMSAAFFTEGSEPEYSVKGLKEFHDEKQQTSQTHGVSERRIVRLPL